MSDVIKKIRAREILSASGRPTVEVALFTEHGGNLSRGVGKSDKTRD